MNQTDGPETERALRAACCEGCAAGVGTYEKRDENGVNIKHNGGYGLCTYNPKLLPLFNAGMERAAELEHKATMMALAEEIAANDVDDAGINAALNTLVAAAAKEAGFRVRFLITGTPDEQAAHVESCILALTPADARQAQRQSPCGKTGHTMATWIKPEYDEDGSPETWASCALCEETRAAIASAETKGWQDCLRNIRASVEGYPNEGGDIEVMTAIQKLIASAEARARLEGDSVYQNWLLQSPWKFQSILSNGLRAPDAATKAVKKCVRWMRTKCCHNADPNKADCYMSAPEMDEELIQQALDELEYLPCHYVHHLADAMRIVALRHPETPVREAAYRLHSLISEEIFHFVPESDEQFTERHKDKRAAAARTLDSNERGKS